MQNNLFLRNDTIFGVCEAIGEDLGFNPNFLRIALILPIFWFPVYMVALYAGLGIVVLASRLLFRDKVAEAPALAADDQDMAADAANQDEALIDAA